MLEGGCWTDKTRYRGDGDDGDGVVVTAGSQSYYVNETVL